MEQFDPVAELRELSYKFAAYILAWPSYTNLICKDCDWDEFYETAAEEEKRKFEEAGKTISSCEKYLSDLQSRMIDLGHIKL